MPRSTYKGKPFQCLTCSKRFSRPEGLTRHRDATHKLPVALEKFRAQQLRAEDPNQNPPAFEDQDIRTPSPDPSLQQPQNSPRRPEAHRRTFKPPTRTELHPILDGTPCDAEGYDFESPENIPVPGQDMADDSDESAAWPFRSPEEFQFADFLYVKSEMPAGGVDTLTHLLATLYKDQPPPFASARELYALIDSIKDGHVPWDSFSVWFRDPLTVLEEQMANPEFNGKIDFAPKRLFRNNKRQYTDLMSGNWAWNQADILAKDEDNHGAMFAPVVLGSDKTTVSAASNLQSSARRAQIGSVALIGFLAIPHILPLSAHMSKPKVTKFGDGCYRRVIYGIGPYIADYPEQALLACIVQGWCPKCTAPSDNLDEDALRYQHVPRSHEHTDKTCNAFSLQQLWDDYGIVGDLIPFTVHFPRADIHELITPDLLHQLIKGTFKDHLVDWIVAYINESYPKQEAANILADIDRWYVIPAVPPFPGLRRFYQGRGFKQWTGNDSKALMKVILPAITGRVPPKMVHAVRDFLEFTYIVRRSTITEDDLERLDNLLQSFHQNRTIFQELGIREGFSLPRQHSMVHYRRSIELFGAPNGLCSSITESKHIKAVKKPYRRSSRNRPLGQMLLTNQRTDKIIAMRTRLRQRHGQRMAGIPELPLTPSITTPQAEDEDGDAVDEPESMGEIKLAKRSELGQPLLTDRIRQYLFNYTTHGIPQSSQDIPLDQCPALNLNEHTIYTYPSARAVFFAPSDLSGIEGMKTEHIRAVHQWQGQGPRYDCVLIGCEADEPEPGFRGYLIARVFLFFKLVSTSTKDAHPLALVQWYSTVGERPCPDTGMWVVQPDFVRGHPSIDVIHLDSILRLAHLIGVNGNMFLPRQNFNFTQSLDAYRSFYANKYADHHSHELVY
ncbi:hypothetical protein BKA70DRAFT_1377252 [Coprinopsis sp. MPI-PUGE-AT-0042]|nr:hypothetical protein BKA70DRAFT_1377252 [Coprinopsis sp. MPI-PUGE-AT-0042]